MVTDCIGSLGVWENTLELDFRGMVSSMQMCVPEATGVPSSGVSIDIPVNCS
jgi:hypothetical protein